MHAAHSAPSPAIEVERQRGRSRTRAGRESELAPASRAEAMIAAITVAAAGTARRQRECRARRERRGEPAIALLVARRRASGTSAPRCPPPKSSTATSAASAATAPRRSGAIIAFLRERMLDGLARTADAVTREFRDVLDLGCFDGDRSAPPGDANRPTCDAGFAFARGVRRGPGRRGPPALRRCQLRPGRVGRRARSGQRRARRADADPPRAAPRRTVPRRFAGAGTPRRRCAAASREPRPIAPAARFHPQIDVRSAGDLARPRRLRAAGRRCRDAERALCRPVQAARATCAAWRRPTCCPTARRSPATTLARAAAAFADRADPDGRRRANGSRSSILTGWAPDPRSPSRPGAAAPRRRWPTRSSRNDQARAAPPASRSAAVRRRHGERAQLDRPHPSHRAGMPAARGAPCHVRGRRRAAAPDAARPAPRWRRRSGPAPRSRRRSPVPRRSSRTSAASGVSPGSTLPPGNSHSPAIGLPGGRCCTSTRPSRRSAPPPTISRHARNFPRHFVNARCATIRSILWGGCGANAMTCECRPSPAAAIAKRATAIEYGLILRADRARHLGALHRARPATTSDMWNNVSAPRCRPRS